MMADDINDDTFFLYSLRRALYTCCDSVGAVAGAAVGGAAAGNVTTMGERPGSTGAPGGIGDMPKICCC